MAQLLATRLKRIGDQLEKTWSTREADSGISCGNTGADGQERLKSLLCTAIHITLLVLAVTRRHL